MFFCLYLLFCIVKFEDNPSKRPFHLKKNVGNIKFLQIMCDLDL